MKIGVQLPEVEREVRWPEMRDIALAVEDTGFDSIWVGDHLLFHDEVTGIRGPMEAWSTLAALAEATTRVALGPLVAATSFHSPAMLAKKAATVDDISGGRLILGLGAGWNAVEYEAFGFPFGHRVARFEEAFTVIRSLLRDGVIDFEGTYYHHYQAELLPPPRPDIPLLIGSNGPRMLRVALPHVEMWNSWFNGFDNRADGLGPLFSLVRSTAEEVGRDPDEIEMTVAVYVQLARGEGRIHGSETRPKTPPIRGSHDEIAGRLRGFDQAGIGHLQVVLDPIDTVAVEELADIVALV